MSDWASNEKDKMLFENWRSYVTEQEEQNSSEEPIKSDDPKILKHIIDPKLSDSLYNVFLSVLKTDLKVKEKRTRFNKLVREIGELIFKMVDNEGIVLENISLSGDRAESRRVLDLSSETGKELINYLNNFNTKSQTLKPKLAKALNRWGRLNSIKFVMPQQQQQAAAPAAQQPQQRGPDKEEAVLSWTDEHFDNAIEQIENEKARESVARVLVYYQNQNPKEKEKFKNILTRMLRGY